MSNVDPIDAKFPWLTPLINKVISPYINMSSALFITGATVFGCGIGFIVTLSSFPPTVVGDAETIRSLYLLCTANFALAGVAIMAGNYSFVNLKISEE